MFACVGSKGLIYIYDLTKSKQSPVVKLDWEQEEYKEQNDTDKWPYVVPGIKLMFNPKQRDFLACGYSDGITKVFKLNYSLSNSKVNEIKTLTKFIDEQEKDI